MDNWYVYSHTRLDKNEIFYIGIGNKPDYKRAHTKFSRNKFWKNIIAKTNYDVDILFQDLNKNNACQKEIELIAKYGRRNLGLGALVNLTDGGEGVTNLKHSEESKRKMSISAKGKSGISIEEQEKIKTLYLNNRSVTSIERETHHRVETIDLVLRINGINRVKRNYRNRIEEDLVKKIKVDIKQGIKRIETLNKYKIDAHIYRDIKRNKTWKHVKLD